MRPSTLQFGQLRLQGVSQAGNETWFRVYPPGLAFDAGRGAAQLAGARDLFLSHGHLDHALGVPYLLSERSLHQNVGTRVFCPRPTAEPLAALVEAAARLEGVTYDWELVPLDPGDRIEVGRDLAIEAFATDHVVPSLGYHLLRAKRRLAAEHRGRTGAELGELRRRGVALEEVVETLALSYCGDTGPGVFHLEPRVFETAVLLLECTFLGDAQRDHGVRYKHLHLDDLKAVEERFENEALVLFHLSRRHRPRDLRAQVDAELPRLAPKIHILGEREAELEPEAGAEGEDALPGADGEGA